ncbi:MAG: CPBP family intramembrane metalloprotease [Thermoanaerobaculia bacterium]|nr:CPBP family intramembrane metalloprotease [Thermoanaerobaculia bacterium]
MTPVDTFLLLGVALPIVAAIVVVAARKGCFRRDPFPAGRRKTGALVALGVTLAATTILPAFSLGRPIDPAALSLGSILALQQLLALFLLSWWLLAGRPPLRGFLALGAPDPFRQARLGVVVGLAGWGLTVAAGLVVLGGLRFAGLDEIRPIPPLVRWLAVQPFLSRVVLVLAAMTVEEVFFRSFLQRRIGAVPASILFLVSHGGYGDPLFFVGLLAITAVLAVTFEKTGSVIAPMVAHGVFDAVQLLLILPSAVRLIPG